MCVVFAMLYSLWITLSYSKPPYTDDVVEDFNSFLEKQRNSIIPDSIRVRYSLIYNLLFMVYALSTHACYYKVTDC